MKYIIYAITAKLLAVILLGCTSVPDDLGQSEVDGLLNARGISAKESRSVARKDSIDSLISSPLNIENAILIALINNSHLQATYAELGIAAADVYEAGRIRNPIFHVSSLDTNESGERNLTTFGLITSFTDLITLPSRKRFAQGKFAAIKQTVGAEALNIAAKTEAAFYEFVGAKQVAALRTQIAKAGNLSLELAKRYHDAGNLTPRELALEHAAASELQLTSLEAKARAFKKRVELATLLGLSAADPWDSLAQLPLPLEREDDVLELIKLARDSRLDLAAAKTHMDILADRYGVTHWTRWLGELDIGIEHEREPDGVELTGPTLEWEIPIFTRNRDQVLRAHADMQTAMAEVQGLMINIENSVRLAHAATQNIKARVMEYQKQLLPARIEAVQRAQEEESFMLIGTFELLETKREEYDAYQGYLEVLRDYWLARTELTRAVGNIVPSSAHASKEYLDVENYLAPKESLMDHSDHQMSHGHDHSSHTQQQESDHSEHEASGDKQDAHKHH